LAGNREPETADPFGNGNAMGKREKVTRVFVGDRHSTQNVVKTQHKELWRESKVPGRQWRRHKKARVLRRGGHSAYTTRRHRGEEYRWAKGSTTTEDFVTQGRGGKKKRGGGS